MSGWLVPLRPGRAGDPVLVCFPAGGGSAGAYRGWAQHAGGLALFGVELPGRAARYGEPFAEDVGEVVRAVAPVIEALGPRVVLYGHSLGALLAFEVVRALEAAGGRAPRSLVVSGRGAPDAPGAGPRLHALPDEAFVGGLRRYGGTPDEVLAHPEMLELLLPILRADFTLSERYVHRPGRPITAEITVLGGADDPTVPVSALAGWATHTTGRCSVVTYPGGHFFLRDLEAAVACRVAAVAHAHARAALTPETYDERTVR